MSWSVETLDQRVDKELLALPADMQAGYLRIAELIEEFGLREVGMPRVKPLKGTRKPKLWEMRMKGRNGIARAIYATAKGNRLIVLHVFAKKSGKTPQRAIDLAKARAKALNQ